MKILTKKNVIIAAISCVVAVVAAFLITNLVNRDKTPPEDTPYYSVSFETNGGGEIETQYIASGSLATKPTDPKKEENSFAGWFSDEKLTIEFDFSTPIENDVVLYAKWNPVSKDDTSKSEVEQKTSNQTSTNAKNQNKKTSGSSSSQNRPNPTPTPAPQPTPTPEPQHTYRIVTTAVDPYSPDVKVSVTEDGATVAFSSIRKNGNEICNSANPYASRAELSSGSYSVTLSSGKVVTATL